MARAAVYIDGFNLYFGMRAAYGRRYLWLDVVDLARRLRPKDEIAVVRYYTAWVKNEPAAVVNQRQYVNALQAYNGSLLSVRLGRFKDRRIRPCRRCRQSYVCACQPPRPFRSYEEKETDVALGTAMVADSALGIGDLTLLVSADSDLVPAVEDVKRVDPTRPFYLALPPGSWSASARFANVGSFHIRESALRAAQLPTTVVEQTSRRAFTRPAKWA